MLVQILKLFIKSYACEQKNKSFMHRQIIILEKLDGFTWLWNLIHEHFPQGLPENPRRKSYSLIVPQQV